MYFSIGLLPGLPCKAANRLVLGYVMIEWESLLPLQRWSFFVSNMDKIQSVFTHFHLSIISKYSETGNASSNQFAWKIHVMITP